MKHLLLLVVCFPIMLFAQDFNSDKIAFTNFLTRMYKSSPFDGVKVIEGENSDFYLVSAIILEKEKYKTEAIMNRVASVKSQSQASTYLNGSYITTDLIVRTKDDGQGNVETEIIEELKEKSSGFVKALEHLTNFKHPKEEGKQVFLFMTKIK